VCGNRLRKVYHYPWDRHTESLKQQQPLHRFLLCPPEKLLDSRPLGQVMMLQHSALYSTELR
jgi:hypothetical protein